MLTLAAAQSSTWGYSILPYPSSYTTISVANGGSVGSFTKPTLAANGKFYSIFTNTTTTINSVSYDNVIVEITPGTTNTGTTNWSAATFNYITPDPGFATRPDGFAKPNWTNGSGTAGAASIAFNTGILAPNGLIYFAPLAHRMTGVNHQWVVFKPGTSSGGMWKKLNLYPVYPTATYPTGFPGVSSYPVLSAPILGADGNIYVSTPNGNTLYRFTPTANAATDEDSLETVIPTPNPLTATTGVWKDEAGNSYTDTVTTAAYITNTSNAASSVFNKTDVISHPNGNIYWIPGSGRGRIFYTKPSLFGTRPYVSAPGLILPGGKTINAYYAFLEKPRDANHLPETLKIYIVSKAPTNTTTQEDELICIDPTDHTISIVNIGIHIKNAAAGGTTNLGKGITLANGLHVNKNYDGTLADGRNVLTGWDIPSSITSGTRIIPNDSPDNFKNSANTDLIKETSPGQSHIGGGSNLPYPHHSKFFGNFGTTLDTLFGEIVSVKEYGPGITNFNFSQRDQGMYSIPITSIGDLAGSFYNANFNKPR